MQYDLAVCYDNLVIYVRYFDCSKLGLWLIFFDAVKWKRFIIIRNFLAHPLEQIECPLGTLVGYNFEISILSCQWLFLFHIIDYLQIRGLCHLKVIPKTYYDDTTASENH